MVILYEAVLVAAALLAWCGLYQSPPPEGATLGSVLVAAAVVYVVWTIHGRRVAAGDERQAAGQWWGPDAVIRHSATPIALGGSLALVIWAFARAETGAKLGGAGSLLVLLTVSAIGMKLVAETYLYSTIGADPSPRQTSAQMMIGELAGWSKLRYTLGVLGGIILPLGAQILAGGAKNIPAVVDAGPPAILATVALACLLPGELLERWLFKRAIGPAKPAIDHLT